MTERGKERLLTALRICSLAVMLILILVFALGMDEISVESVLNYTPENRIAAALVLILFYALKSLTAVFPVIVLQVASGVIFSPAAALLVNVVGMAVEMTVPYFLGRFAGAGQMERIINKYPRLKPLSDLPRGNVWFASYIMRILGFLPVDIVSMLCGSLNVNYFKYIIGSSAGVFPGLVAVTIIGSSIMDPTSPAFIISCSVMLAISAASLVIYAVVKKRQAAKSTEVNDAGK